jgi:sporulation protein YlmC with PRC-barrel domain
MKRILATTAIVALTAMPVLAQSETTDQTTPSTTQSSDMSGDPSGTKANTDTSIGATADTGDMPHLTDTERAALTAEDLEGVAIYDATDEHVGEISDIILTDDGQVEQVIVDVGGFLGLGEKPVAVSFDEIDISRDQDGATDALQATTSLTVEEFEAMQEWQG